MRQYLLFVLSLVSVAISVNATISEDDIPPVFNADRSVYDPNDHTPEEVVQFIRDYIQDNYVASNIPSPLDADYYLDLFTERKLIPLYYMEEDSCYVCDVPVLRGEWKFIPRHILRPPTMTVMNIYGVPANRTRLQGVVGVHIS